MTTTTANLSLTVNVQGAADILKVHPKTVLDLIERCEIPAAREGRAYVMFTKDVVAHLENQITIQTAKRMGRRPAKAPFALPD